MNTLFIYVSPQNCDNDISNIIERNFISLDKKCQQWSVDFFFFPILFKAFDHEKIYEVWPMMRGLSIDDIYERTIMAYQNELTITAPGIIVIRDDYPSEFIELPKIDFMLAWDYILSQYGECDDSWNKYKPHTCHRSTEIYPTEIIEFRRKVYDNTVCAAFSPQEQAEVNTFYSKYCNRLPLHDIKRYVRIDDDTTSNNNDTLSDIEYSFENRSFRFVSYDKEIHLPAAVAVLFLLLLKHPKGISTREFVNLENEITKYYDNFRGSGKDFIKNITEKKDDNKKKYFSDLKSILVSNNINPDNYAAENIAEKIKDAKGKEIQIDSIYKINAAASITVKEK